MSKEQGNSNQEVIEEVTSDLESQLKEKIDLNDYKSSTETPLTGELDECSDNDSGTSDDEKDHDNDDIIDEEELKRIEATLSDKEIAKRKDEASQLKKQGNEEYKNQKYLESVFTYTKALKTCPTKYTEERSILYGNRAASKINIGKKKSAIDDCTKSIELNNKYLRAYLRRAKLYEEEDKLEESLEDFKKVLELDPRCIEALSASQRLPPKITEKNEKLKEEMLGKLKDLGNLILKPFGLSTDNFKLQQNSETGGYSVNFEQNKSSNP